MQDLCRAFGDGLRRSLHEQGVGSGKVVFKGRKCPWEVGRSSTQP